MVESKMKVNFTFPYGKAKKPWKIWQLEAKNHPIEEQFINKTIWTIHLHDFGFKTFIFQGFKWDKHDFW